jgi:hypothetical protein
LLKPETVITAGFVLLLVFGALALFGLAGIGAVLVVAGLGLSVWLFALLLLPSGVEWLLLFVPEQTFPARLIVTVGLIGLALIAVGIILVALDPQTGREGIRVTNP